MKECCATFAALVSKSALSLDSDTLHARIATKSLLLSDTMKLIIAGSRSVTDYEALRKALVQSGLWKEHKTAIEVVCGMARGADTLGKTFAERNNLKLHEFPADWDNIEAPGAVVKIQQSTGLLYNAVAGHNRNQQMADFADALLLLWDGVSSGSQDMLKRAKKKGLPIYGFICKGSTVSPMP